jgi:hypothetical protein
MNKNCIFAKGKRNNMNNEIFEYLSSRSGDAKTTENCRRCRLYEKKSADSFNDVRNHNLFFPLNPHTNLPLTRQVFYCSLL